MTSHSEHTSLLLAKLADTPSRSDDGDAKNKNEVRILLIACGLTLGFFFVQLIGGYLAASLAIISDAAHMLFDLSGFAISLFAVILARKPPTDTMTFGYGRAEVIGALTSIGLLWCLAAVLSVYAIPRLLNPQPVDAPLMLLLGVIGLIANLILGLVLGHGSHGHDHGHHDHHEHHDYHGHHDHHHHEKSDNGSPAGFWRRITGADIESVNLRAAYLHILGDILQNVGVVVAAILILIHPRWTIMDPICTIFFACVVIYTTKGIAFEMLNVILEGTPSGISRHQVIERLGSIYGVLRVEDLHIWSITMEEKRLMVRLFTNKNNKSSELLSAAKEVLRSEFGIEHATVEISDEE